MTSPALGLRIAGAKFLPVREDDEIDMHVVIVEARRVSGDRYDVARFERVALQASALRAVM